MDSKIKLFRFENIYKNWVKVFGYFFKRKHFCQFHFCLSFQWGVNTSGKEFAPLGENYFL